MDDFKDKMVNYYKHIILNDYKKNMHNINWHYFFSAFLLLLNNLKDTYSVYVCNINKNIDIPSIKEIAENYNIGLTKINDKLVFYISKNRIEEYLINNLFKYRRI